MNLIWIGFDSRPAEATAFAVARFSINRRLTQQIPVRGLVLSDLQAKGLYTRPIEWRKRTADKPIMWDVLSDAPMATEFACSRFLVPHLDGLSRRILFQSIGDPAVHYSDGDRSGWALFMDGDMLVRGNLARVFEGLDSSKAVYCVKHRHEPPAGIKMDGQEQTRYARKNWSSFMIFNRGHAANAALTLEMINTVPGRDLHRFCWLKDEEIGELGPEWNFLVGHSDPSIDPKVVHFTDGVPNMPGYEDVPYADEWRAEFQQWAA